MGYSHFSRGCCPSLPIVPQRRIFPSPSDSMRWSIVRAFTSCSVFVLDSRFPVKRITARLFLLATLYSCFRVPPSRLHGFLATPCRMVSSPSALRHPSHDARTAAQSFFGRVECLALFPNCLTIMRGLLSGTPGCTNYREFHV